MTSPLERPSRSAKKREAQALQALGEQLTTLDRQRRRELNLPDDLTEALDDYERFSQHEARRRQLQRIGKLMRSLDPETILFLSQEMKKNA